MTNLNEAFRMLDTFASVGATHFDLTHINIDGEKRGFRPQQTLAQLKNSLPRLFPGATARQNNIIVRPHSDTAQLIQLDDLKAEALAQGPRCRLSDSANEPRQSSGMGSSIGTQQRRGDQRICEETAQRGRGRPVRVRRDPRRRHRELQTQIRTRFPDGEDY